MFIEIGLVVSVLFNIVFSAGLVYLYKKPIQRNVTYDARKLLHDLTSGKALVKIEAVDTSDLFFRSFKG